MPAVPRRKVSRSSPIGELCRHLQPPYSKLMRGRNNLGSLELLQMRTCTSSWQAKPASADTHFQKHFYKYVLDSVMHTVALQGR